MSRIRILTLGTAAVSPGNLSQQPKRLALLAYLAIAKPRGPHRRDDLIALLWPEMSQDRARSALRQALHSLRKSLGDDIILNSGAELVQLNADGVDCDLWELERALDLGDARVVAELFHAELLRGLFVSDAIEFGDWLDAERGRLRDRVVQAYWQFAANTNAAQRAEWIARIVALAPLDENAVRRGMSRLNADGNACAALALFEQLTTVLLREMQIQPSAETQQLAIAIRQQRANVSVRATSPSPPAFAEAEDFRVAGSNAIAAPIVAYSKPPSRWRKRSVMIAASMLTLATTIASAAVLSSKFGARDPRTIAVASEFGATTDSATRALVSAATMAVRHAIAQSNLFKVLDTTTHALASASTVVRVGVDHATGSYAINSSIVSHDGNVILDGISGPQFSSTDDAFAKGAERVASALATTLYHGWARSLSQPPTIAAYRAFVAGMDQIVREQHDSAISLFLEAYHADSSFTAAGLLAGAELCHANRFAAADSLARSIANRRSALPDVDRALLDWLQFSLAGDRTSAFAAMRDVTRLAPGAELAWLQLATEAAENGDLQLSLKLFDDMREAPTFNDRWLAYRANRAEVLHMLGDHQRELRELTATLRAHPEMKMLDTYELRARAALLDTAIIWPRLQVLVETNDSHVPTMLRQVAMELRAHGDAVSASRTLAMARQWYARLTDTTTTSYLVGVARVAFQQDDRATARAAYAQISARQESCIECLGASGVLAARDHNTTDALRADSLLARVSRPYLFGLNTVWRARIAGALGDAQRSRVLYSAAREQGTEIDVLTHTDPDLRLPLGDARGPVAVRVTR